MMRTIRLTAVFSLLALAFLSAAPSMAQDDQHTHEWEFETHVDYTCDEDGYDVYVCSLCGETERRVTDEASHRNEIVRERAATCEEKGEIEYVCTVCGEKTVVTTPPLEHEWDSGTVESKPTMFTEGTVKFVCKRDPTHVKYEKTPSVISTDPESAFEFYLIAGAVFLSLLTAVIMTAIKKKKR